MADIKLDSGPGSPDDPKVAVELQGVNQEEEGTVTSKDGAGPAGPGDGD